MTHAKPIGVDLTALNSFGVPARAARLVRVDQLDVLPSLEFDVQRDLVRGGGSNVLLAGDVPGTVLQVALRGRKQERLDDDVTRVTLAAGEPWHEAVRWSLEQGLAGLENLSLIPGLVGAAPMQNIGAYGVELAEHLHTVTAWDWQTRQLRTLDRAACEFAYRDSRFKSGEPGRFLITSVTLDLHHTCQPRLEYAGVRETLAEQGQDPDKATALAISDAVIHLRRRKLPDPARLGNAGSFFKNPMVSEQQAGVLAEAHPGLPLFRDRTGQIKASAGWMIEAGGWKGYREGDAGVSERHALVLVNHGDATGPELAALAAKIQAEVLQRMGIALEPEPRILFAA